MPPTKLTFGGVPEHFNLPWHLACEAGAFEQADLEIEFVDFPGGTGALTRALAENEIDVAIVLTEGGVADILNKGENRLCKVFVQSPLVWGIHVAASSRFESMDDVRGGRYAISRHGSGSHLMAIVDASERGWDLDALQFVPVGGLAGALESLPESGAELFLWEKFMTQPHVDDGTFRRIEERPTRWPSFMASAGLETLKSSGPQIRDAFEIVSGYCSNVKNNVGNVGVISSRYDLRLDDVRHWLDAVQWSSSFERPDAALEQVIHYLEKLHLVPLQDANPADVWFHL